MKQLSHYINEVLQGDNPLVGDFVAIELSEDSLIESYVTDLVEDGVVLTADDTFIQLLESHGCTLEDIATYGAAGHSAGYGHSLPEGEGLGYSRDPEQAKWYHAGRNAHKGGTAGGTIQDIAKKHGCPAEWIDAFRAGYQDQAGWSKQGVSEEQKTFKRIMELAGVADYKFNQEDDVYREDQDAAVVAQKELDDVITDPMPGVHEEIERDQSPVERAILHRILMQHPGMLQKHGPEKVMMAVEEVADFVGDVDEIGSSDVSGWIRHVEQMLNNMGDQVEETTDSGINFQGRMVDRASLEIDDVHSWDYPDFSDAYISYATYTDGTPLSDGELEQFNDQHSDLVHELAYDSLHESEMDEAKYHGREVPLGKPMPGDVKKSKVYVRDPATGNIKKVNFGHGGTSAKRAGQKPMHIKKSNPARRKSFRARHNCDNPGPRTKARYWSCRAW